MNVAALKAADYLHDRVDFADVAEELVTEAFSRARPFDQSGNVDELNRGRHNFLRMGKLGEFCESLVGHSHDAKIWIDRAEGIIGGGRFMRSRDGVEERRLSDVRQSNDSSAQHRRGR